MVTPDGTEGRDFRLTDVRAHFIETILT